MADATYAQSNFQGGELSPAYQGRVDDPDYKKSLALCLNYIPNQEASLSPRSGFKRIGNTKANAPARLLPFRFTPQEPYVAEFTANNLRLWANGLPILTPEIAGFVSVAGDPPTFTIQDTRTVGTGLVPAEWADGDSVLVLLWNREAVEHAGHLASREFTLNIVSAPAGTITLTDAVTGSPLTGAITGLAGSGAGYIRFVRIRDEVTEYDDQDGVRQVQFTSQVVRGVNGSSALRFTPPDRKVTYFHPLVSPQSLSFELGVQRGLVREKFIDGPYLDSFGTDIPMTISGVTGEITVTIHGYDAAIIYRKGDIAVNYVGGDPFYLLSLTDQNVGNAVPASPPYVTAHWVSINCNEKSWSNGTTYNKAQAVEWSPYGDDGVGTIYYSIAAGNVGNQPDLSPLDWTTTLPAWDILATYPAAAWVSSSGITYVSVSIPVVGTAPAAAPTVWIAVDSLPDVFDALTNTRTGLLSSPLFYVDDAGGSQSSINKDNPSRLIRLKVGPQPWSKLFSYSIGNSINFNDVIYKSLTNSNLANQPDTDAVNWEIQTTTIQWTWGKITYAGDHMLQATVLIMGDDLQSSGAVWEFRMGVYSDSTGWPTCGCYHEGRVYLGGVFPNRFDASCPNQGYNFSPTASDGTVSDGNGIAGTINAEESENIVAFASITEGVILFTSESEWLIAASALNDPITPTSVQAHRTTAWSSLPTEATRLPSALAAIQSGGRRVLEFRTFVDQASYQSRLNTVDLTLRCQHLTANGVGATQYQSLAQPVIWCSAAPNLIANFSPLTHSFCPLPITAPTAEESDSGANLFGIGYSRTPSLSYAAPFSFEHGLTLSTGIKQTIDSIAVQRGLLDTSEYLYATVTDSEGLAYMEMMMPLFESEPLASTYRGDGSIEEFGTLAFAYFVDAGRTPAGCKIASDQSGATFYGLQQLAGESVSFTILGKYVGDFTIGADGSIVVPFSTAFLISDIGRAMYNIDLYNTTNLPAYQQRFELDLNGSTADDVKNGSIETNGFLGQFGYKYRRRGQMLRPQIGSQNGPTFAKTVRNDQAGIYLSAAQEVSAGGSFSNLVPVKLTKDGTRDVNPPGPADFVTGIFRVYIKDNYGFDGQICWEQTRPVPGAVLGVGGFDLVMDK